MGYLRLKKDKNKPPPTKKKKGGQDQNQNLMRSFLFKRLIQQGSTVAQHPAVSSENQLYSPVVQN